MLLSNGSLASGPQLTGLADQGSSFGQMSYYGTNDLQIGSREWAAYGHLFKTQLWVGILVRKLGFATARNPFVIRRRVSETEIRPESGPLAALMRTPNAELSGFDLWLWTSHTYDIYGEAFWYKMRDRRGAVREIHPLHPTKVTVRRNEQGEIEYLYGGGTAGTAQLAIPSRDVVAFKNYNPENTRRGLSNLEGLRMTLLNETAARRANASWWEKGARPSLVMSHPKAMSDASFERLKTQFNSDNAGANNMGKVLFAEEGMTATPLQLTAEEMQYIESRRLNREEACSAYDVPPPVVHILDRATFSNITEQLRSMYRDTMAPRFTLFESVIDHQLVPDFYPATGEVETKFDMDDVLRGDFETRATAVGTLIEKGVYKPSEARPLFGLAPGGAEADQLYANAALVPLGSTGSRQPVATDGTLIPEPVTARSIARGTARPAVRALMGRISRVKSSPDATRDRLTAEHLRELTEFFAEQRDAVLATATEKASTLFAPDEWDEKLAEILETLSIATTAAVGSGIATGLGGSYDGSDVESWIAEDAKASAKRINRTTKDQIDAAIAAMTEEDSLEDTIGRLFDDGTTSTRAEEISTARVATLVGLVTLVAGSQVAQQKGKTATKTWNVRSSKPRSAHALMDGETVGINETFSNGMNAPGDPAGGADEVAGCLCGMTINFE